MVDASGTATRVRSAQPATTRLITRSSGSAARVRGTQPAGGLLITRLESGSSVRGRSAQPASPQIISLSSGTAVRSRDGSANPIQYQLVLSDGGTAVRALRGSAVTGEVDLPALSADFTFTIASSAATSIPSVPIANPSAPLAARRWQFEDPITKDVFVFPINPKTSSSVGAEMRVTESETTTGRPISHEGNSLPVVWAVTGTFTTQAQHDALETWTAKPYRLFLTDDLGRQYVVFITDFAPVIAKAGPNPWYQAYTLTMLNFADVTGEGAG